MHIRGWCKVRKRRFSIVKGCGIRKDLSTELFQRIIDYSTLEISWYIKNPIKGHLVVGAIIERDEEIRSKTIEQYGCKGENI